MARKIGKRFKKATFSKKGAPRSKPRARVQPIHGGGK
jgi:hypothetical protein